MDTAPLQDSPHHILNILDDDCIQLVLLQITYAEDFLSAAETCVRFQSNAKKCFRSKYKRIYISENSPRNAVTRGVYFYLIVPYDCVYRFLGIFGNLIDWITFHNYRRTEKERLSKEVANMIAHFCGRTLKKFEASGDDLDFNGQPFSGLEELKLFFATVKNFETGSQLKKMTLQSRVFKYKKGRPLNNWLNKNFPNLEEVIMDGNNIKRPVLVEFLTMNPQIKTLHIDFCVSLTSSILQNIGNRVPNLECLKIKLCGRRRVDDANLETNMKQISGLRKLKSLQITCMGALPTVIDTIVQNNIPIEDFRYRNLNYTDVDVPLDCVLKLKRLNKLWLNRVSEQMLFVLVKQMTSLEELVVMKTTDISLRSMKKALEYGKQLSLLGFYMEEEINIDSNEYNSLLRLAKDHVKVFIECYKYTSDIPEDVLKMNRKWIEITDVYMSMDVSIRKYLLIL